MRRQEVQSLFEVASIFVIFLGGMLVVVGARPEARPSEKGLPHKTDPAKFVLQFTGLDAREGVI